MTPYPSETIAQLHKEQERHIKLAEKMEGKAYRHRQQAALILSAIVKIEQKEANQPKIQLPPLHPSFPPPEEGKPAELDPAGISLSGPVLAGPKVVDASAAAEIVDNGGKVLSLRSGRTFGGGVDVVSNEDLQHHAPYEVLSVIGKRPGPEWAMMEYDANDPLGHHIPPEAWQGEIELPQGVAEGSFKQADYFGLSGVGWQHIESGIDGKTAWDEYVLKGKAIKDISVVYPSFWGLELLPQGFDPLKAQFPFDHRFVPVENIGEAFKMIEADKRRKADGSLAEPGDHRNHALDDEYFERERQRLAQPPQPNDNEKDKADEEQEVFDGDNADGLPRVNDPLE